MSFQKTTFIENMYNMLRELGSKRERSSERHSGHDGNEPYGGSNKNETAF